MLRDHYKVHKPNKFDKIRWYKQNKTITAKHMDQSALSTHCNKVASAIINTNTTTTEQCTKAVQDKTYTTIVAGQHYLSPTHQN